MSPHRTIATLPSGLTADLRFRFLLAKARLRLDQPEKVVEIGDSRSRKFCGGCGFRCSLWWSLVLED
jgi:hypothetical protein